MLSTADTRKPTMPPTITPKINFNIGTSTTFYKGGVYTYSVSAPGAVSDAASSVAEATATGC